MSVLPVRHCIASITYHAQETAKYSFCCSLCMCRLVTLSLAGNQLGGALDSYKWTSLSSLSSINMSRNSFTGMLPTAWGALRGNAVIDISYNNVTGPLPANWSTVGADGLVMPLSYLDVSYNSLTGVPDFNWHAYTSAARVGTDMGHKRVCLPGFTVYIVQQS